MSTTFSFQIPNWEKYNPRNDRKSHVWFRLENTFFSDQKIFGLTASQVALMLFLFCESSKAMGKVVTMQVAYLIAMLKIKPSEIISDLTVLHDRGLIELKPDTSRCQLVSGGNHLVSDGSPTNKQTIQTIQTNKHMPETVVGSSDLPTPDTRGQAAPKGAVFDFESLYRKFPRKDGKSAGMKTAKVQIKTQADYDNLSTAIDRYNEHIKLEAKEARYIKHFSTFMNQWRDWLDPETGSVTLAPKRTAFDEARERLGIPHDV